ncbi:hypothetical protein ACLB2K_067087 [Fragaria x ananassa]
MAKSSEAVDGSRATPKDRNSLGEDRTRGAVARNEGTGERLECIPIGNDRESTPDGTMHDLMQEEVEDIVERLRVDVARLERERVHDCLEATTQEEKLERDNATIMSVLARRLESDEVIERAASTLREKQVEGRGSPITPPTVSRRTVHVGANLFSESMEREGPPPLPTFVEERVSEPM